MSKSTTFGDTWATQYGELLNKTQVARMLGVSRRTIQRRTDEGNYRTNADGRLIFTRSVAAYEETGIPQGIPSTNCIPQFDEIKSVRGRQVLADPLKCKYRIERS
jgi:hypothetical protein